MVAISKAAGFLLVGPSLFSDVPSQDQLSLGNYRFPTYLGGRAPFVQHPGYGISTEPPQTCKVVQVQLLSRHGERYPTKSVAKSVKNFYEKIKAVKWDGDLEFINDLTFFIEDPSNIALETNSTNAPDGYQGIATMELHGKVFKQRYGHLYNPDKKLPFFTTNNDRMYHSAEAFAKGFFDNDLSNAEIVVIPEDRLQGLNSLTPKIGCPAFNTDTKSIAKKYPEEWIDKLVERFLKAKLTKNEAYEVFDYCAFELNVRGTSQMCNVPTSEDYVHNSYFYDLQNYYSHGPGNPWSRTVGSVPLDAMTRLLDSPDGIWLSFAHDDDIDHFLSALGLVTPDEDLDPTRLQFDRTYNHGYLVPQGTRVYTEKLECGDKTFVRFILNDAVIPLKQCYDGPGLSCEINDFKTLVNETLLVKNFQKNCFTPEDAPQELTFYWDWDKKTYTAPLFP